MDIKNLLFLISAIALGYGNSMGDVNGVVPPMSFLLLALSFAFDSFEFRDVFCNSDSKIYNSCKKSICCFLSYFAIFLFFVLFTQKLVCPYFWVGNMSDSYWDKTSQSSIPYLRGFKLSENELIMFDKMSEIISYYSDDTSVIFCFPYCKIYNVLQNNYNLELFSPIHFYDVVSDKCVIDDCKILEEKEPDIVIWHDIPNCISSHEILYREGEELKQRQIAYWFSDQLNKGNYILVGQVDNIFVYKYNDNSVMDLFYIQDSNAVNSTGMGEEL